MQDVVQVKAEIPRDLKRRAFSALALRERKFAHWLRDSLQHWVEEAEQDNANKESDSAGMVRSATRQ